MSDSILNAASGPVLSASNGAVSMNQGCGVYEPETRWYAVWTRSRQEKAAATALGALGIQHFLPLHRELRQWSDRKQLVEVPLFSGYLFVCINPTDHIKSTVLKIPGVAALVGNQCGATSIPEQQIQAIRAVLGARIESSVCASFHEGERVRVVRGPLAGVEGTLIRTLSTSRLLISIELIRQSLSVNIMCEDVVPIRAREALYECLGPPRGDFRVQPPQGYLA